MWYVVCYELFGYANSFTCQTYSQYSAFIGTMEENFSEQFKVEQILTSKE